MGKVKGTTIAGRLAYARRRGGDEAVQKVVAAIRDPEAKLDLADGRALKSSWYPFSALIDISVELDRLYGSGDLSLLVEVGGDVAEADLNSVYKIFFKVANPQFIIDRAASVWRSYYSSGTCRVEKKAPNHVILELADFDEPHRAHCNSVLGWAARMLTLSSCKDLVAEHILCRTEGGATCRFEAHWT